ncbi:MAG: ABC transporter permease, partial [Myxococcota bacterium]
MRQEATGFSAAAGSQRSPGRAGWLLLAPLIFWAVAFVVAPAVIMLVYSFLSRGTLGGVVLDFTLDNYRGVVDPVYLQIVVRSLIYAAITTLLCLAAGYPVAYLIGRANPRWRNLLLMAVMVPFWTSFLIRTYAWIWILGGNGLPALISWAGLGDIRLINTPFAVLIGIVYGYL